MFEKNFTDRLLDALKKEKKRTGSKLDIATFIDIFYVHAESSIGNMEEDEDLLQMLEDGSDDNLMKGLEDALSLTIAESKNRFESFPQCVRENMLMETASAITEVMAGFLNEKQINRKKADDYGPSERRDLAVQLARRFEETYASTKAFEDDYEDLVTCYALRELTEIFS